LAEELYNNGYFYILHRFYEPHDILQWVNQMANKYSKFIFSLSVGVNDKDRDFLTKLRNILTPYNQHSLIITIDIAHGYCRLMNEMIEFIRHNLPEVKIIAGNVAGDYDSIINLQYWGVHAIKVGIGMGLACTTYDCTGFTSPMFSAGVEASNASVVPLIGDGGVQCPGDITKGLVAGYTMIMIGSLFAACNDSPARLDSYTGDSKHYYGSASSNGKKSLTHIEGKSTMVPLNNSTYLEKMKYFEEHLQSSISYAGGNKLQDLLTVDYHAFQ
jgi:GMP reductase